MTEQATQDVAVQATGMVLDKLDQYMVAATEVITKYGGDAVDLGLNVLRIEAASSLLVGIMLATVAGILLSKIPKWWKTGERIQNWDSAETKEEKEMLRRKYAKDEDGAWFVLSGISAIASLVILIISAAELVDIWNWIGIFWPEAYAVHKFLL